MLLGVALAFEVPVFVLALVRLRIMTAAQLRRTWRVGVFVMTVIGVLLPGVDPVSTILSVIPLVLRTQKAFVSWLKPAFAPFRFDYDVDRIDALSSDRESEWRRIDSASFLTQDEKREAAGYGALPRGSPSS